MEAISSVLMDVFLFPITLTLLFWWVSLVTNVEAIGGFLMGEFLFKITYSFFLFDVMQFFEVFHILPLFLVKKGIFD